MSTTREHYDSTLLDMDGKLSSVPRPGDLVRNYYNSNQVGIVLEKIGASQSRVLWGEYTDPYSRFVWNAYRPTNTNEIAKDMFPVQQMPQGALPAYLDEMCKEDEE